MFKLEKYNKILISTVAALSITTVCATEVSDNWEKKADISGGVYYPIVGDQTGPYKVNPQVYGERSIKIRHLNHGRVPSANELAAWDKDVMPDGTGLPEGSGSVEDGEALYEAQCVACHGDFGAGASGEAGIYPALAKGNAEELKETLTNNRWKDPDVEGPERVFGSYWPQASTLWWYIRDAMPHTKSKTLTADETYALVAYILNINEMSIDGEEVDDEYVLDREKFLKIKMPNEDGFIPNIDGENGLENVRKFYAEAKNYGAIRLDDPSKRCMTNCQDTDNIVRVDGGISDFTPPMSVERTLPEVKNDGAHKVTFDAKQAYQNNCSMCHENGVAPAAGDKAGWEPYMAKGLSKVYENGLNGTNMGMPAKGGASVSDDEFRQIVDYILKF